MRRLSVCSIRRRSPASLPVIRAKRKEPKTSQLLRAVRNKNSVLTVHKLAIRFVWRSRSDSNGQPGTFEEPCSIQLSYVTHHKGRTVARPAHTLSAIRQVESRHNDGSQQCFVDLRHRRNLRAACLSVRGFVNPPIG